MDKLNPHLYRMCKKELLSKKAKSIIKSYSREAGKYQKSYTPEWLSIYYSPSLTVLRQYLGELKGKDILEVGYGLPLFVMYLRSAGAHVIGIDINPYITEKDLHRMSIEDVPAGFKWKNRKRFDAIVERIALSKLYDENYFAKTGKHRFKDRRKILRTLYRLLKKKGLLVLQDDRGSIFNRKEMTEIGFKVVLTKDRINFSDGRNKKVGWNTLAVYRK